MKAAKYISQFLEKKNNVLWGYIGGFNADILEHFCENTNNKFILNYHEQAASFAANAYAVITETPSIAIASGAPSACNLVGGIANAYFDSIPCVFIVGSPHSLAIRKDKRIRQNAFEEIDIVHLVSDITKYAVALRDARDIKYELEKAFHIATTGRKGPVLIDIPYNIAREEVDCANLRSFKPQTDLSLQLDIKKILAIFKDSKRPLILVGGGARSSKARMLLRELLNKVEIPVVASLCGLDVLSHDHSCYLGFIGHYGNRYANIAVANADCLVVLGSRLDERQLGGYRTKLNDNVKVIRVDIDPHELGRKFRETISIESSVESFLTSLTKANYQNINFDSWVRIVQQWKKRYPSYISDSKILSANNFMHKISDYLPEDCIICADVGQNQMSVAQAIRLDKNRRLLNSAGYGSMGFSLPAAIGAAYAKPSTVILSVNGDGGIQMNIQELHTIKRDNLPIKIIVLNNSCLGMIRKTQEKLFKGKTFVSVDGYSLPNFESVAKAYGIKYLKITRISEDQKLENHLRSNEPCFIEVVLPTKMVNIPEPGDTIDGQYPLLTRFEKIQINNELKHLV